MTATAPAHARSSRSAHRRAPAAPRPELRVLGPAPARAGRGVFTLVVIGVLAVGLLALLVINTTLAQGAFTVTSLDKQQRELARQEQVLQRSVADAAAPATLQKQAQKLGMVPARTPAFIRLSDGKVLGDPKPAFKPYVAPSTKPKPSTAASPAGAATPAAGAAAVAGAGTAASASPSPAASGSDAALPADATAAEAGDAGPSPAAGIDAAVPAPRPATPAAAAPGTDAATPAAATKPGTKPGTKPAAKPGTKPVATARPQAVSDAASPAPRVAPPAVATPRSAR